MPTRTARLAALLVRTQRARVRYLRLVQKLERERQRAIRNG